MNVYCLSGANDTSFLQQVLTEGLIQLAVFLGIILFEGLQCRMNQLLGMILFLKQPQQIREANILHRVDSRLFSGVSQRKKRLKIAGRCQLQIVKGE